MLSCPSQAFIHICLQPHAAMHHRWCHACALLFHCGHSCNLITLVAPVSHGITDCRSCIHSESLCSHHWCPCAPLALPSSNPWKAWTLAPCAGVAINSSCGDSLSRFPQLSPCSSHCRAHFIGLSCRPLPEHRSTRSCTGQSLASFVQCPHRHCLFLSVFCSPSV